jgi:hypothetical protein
MGPVFPLSHNADGMGWAQCFSQDMWSMTLLGPSGGAGSCRRWCGVAPLFLRIILTTVLDGTCGSADPCCRSHLIGPVLLPTSISNGMGVGPLFSEGIQSMALNGPVVVLSHVVDDTGWTQFFPQSHIADGMGLTHCFSGTSLSMALS